MLLPKLDSFSRIGLAPKVASYAVDAALLLRLEKFVAEKVGDAGRESVHRERLPQVDAWLRDHAASWTAK